MPPEFHIAYYISAHGYGHGVRSASIIRALLSEAPQACVTVVSELPHEFLQNRLPSERIRYRSAAFDVGMVQLDSIRVDVDATYHRVRELMCNADRLVAEESRFLETEGVGAVVSDIPSLPLEAAHLAGLPRVAVGNFAWDWIYAPFIERKQEWKELVDRFQRGYALADVLLKLPFSEPMEVFPVKQDLPLVAEPGRIRRGEIADLTGADPGKKWILLSFTTLDWDENALEHVQDLDGYAFFTVRPLAWGGHNLFAIDREVVPFSDVLTTCDAVVSKPGFGILSECVVNRKPLIYAEREDFIEYPILVKAVEQYLQNIHLPSKDLYEGKPSASLDLIWSQPIPSDTVPGGGARMAAKTILEAAYSANC